jgi:hypothetical protein
MKIRINEGWLDVNDLKLKRLNSWVRGNIVYYKIDGVWTIARRHEIIETFQIRVGTFNAPQVWYGFYKQGSPDPGTVSPAYYRGLEIRDFNSPDDNQTGFQFGLYAKGDSSKVIAVEIEGLGRLPFKSTNQGSSDTITRRYFSDGVKNVHQYLKSQYGKTLTIKLIHDPV